MNKMNRTELDQRGLVSIVVTMIIMTILSLITISFAQIMAREQRQALDRQLSSQAFYSAESGINDALANPGSYNDSTCTSGDVDSSLSARFTCVTYSDETQDYQDDAVPTDPHTPTVFPLPAGTAEVEVRYSPSSVSSGAANRTNMDLPPQSTWATKTGALKMQIIPFTNGDSQSVLSSRHAVAIVIPRESTFTNAYTMTDLTGVNFGDKIGARCSAAGECVYRISGIDTGANAVTVVMSSIYLESSIRVIAYNSTGTVIPFVGVQAIVDSTGRTTDVVRRIQVRKPLIPRYTVPGGALESTGNGPNDGICKQFSTSPAGTSNITPNCPF